VKRLVRHPTPSTEQTKIALTNSDGAKTSLNFRIGNRRRQQQNLTRVHADGRLIAYALLLMLDESRLELSRRLGADTPTPFTRRSCYKPVNPVAGASFQ
jgi:hypothetical protein